MAWFNPFAPPEQAQTDNLNAIDQAQAAGVKGGSYTAPVLSGGISDSGARNDVLASRRKLMERLNGTDFDEQTGSFSFVPAYTTDVNRDAYDALASSGGTFDSEYIQAPSQVTDSGAMSSTRRRKTRVTFGEYEPTEEERAQEVQNFQTRTKWHRDLLSDRIIPGMAAEFKGYDPSIRWSDPKKEGQKGYEGETIRFSQVLPELNSTKYDNPNDAGARERFDAILDGVYAQAGSMGLLPESYETGMSGDKDFHRITQALDAIGAPRYWKGRGVFRNREQSDRLKGMADAYGEEVRQTKTENDYVFNTEAGWHLAGMRTGWSWGNAASTFGHDKEGQKSYQEELDKPRDYYDGLSIRQVRDYFDTRAETDALESRTSVAAKNRYEYFTKLVHDRYKQMVDERTAVGVLVDASARAATREFVMNTWSTVRGIAGLFDDDLARDRDFWDRMDYSERELKGLMPEYSGDSMLLGGLQSFVELGVQQGKMAMLGGVGYGVARGAAAAKNIYQFGKAGRNIADMANRFTALDRLQRWSNAGFRTGQWFSTAILNEADVASQMANEYIARGLDPDDVGWGEKVALTAWYTAWDGMFNPFIKGVRMRVPSMRGAVGPTPGTILPPIWTGKLGTTLKNWVKATAKDVGFEVMQEGVQQLGSNFWSAGRFGTFGMASNGEVTAEGNTDWDKVAESYEKQSKEIFWGTLFGSAGGHLGRTLEERKFDRAAIAKLERIPLEEFHRNGVEVSDVHNLTVADRIGIYESLRLHSAATGLKQKLAVAENAEKEGKAGAGDLVESLKKQLDRLQANNNVFYNRATKEGKAVLRRLNERIGDDIVEFGGDNLALRGGRENNRHDLDAAALQEDRSIKRRAVEASGKYRNKRRLFTWGERAGGPSQITFTEETDENGRSETLYIQNNRDLRSPRGVSLEINRLDNETEDEFLARALSVAQDLANYHADLALLDEDTARFAQGLLKNLGSENATVSFYSSEAELMARIEDLQRDGKLGQVNLSDMLDEDGKLRMDVGGFEFGDVVFVRRGANQTVGELTATLAHESGHARLFGAASELAEGDEDRLRAICEASGESPERVKRFIEDLRDIDEKDRVFVIRSMLVGADDAYRIAGVFAAAARAGRSLSASERELVKRFSEDATRREETLAYTEQVNWGTPDGNAALPGKSVWQRARTHIVHPFRAQRYYEFSKKYPAMDAITKAMLSRWLGGGKIDNDDAMDFIGALSQRDGPATDLAPTILGRGIPASRSAIMADALSALAGKDLTGLTNEDRGQIMSAMERVSNLTKEDSFGNKGLERPEALGRVVRELLANNAPDAVVDELMRQLQDESVLSPAALAWFNQTAKAVDAARNKKQAGPEAPAPAPSPAKPAPSTAPTSPAEPSPAGPAPSPAPSAEPASYTPPEAVVNRIADLGKKPPEGGKAVQSSPVNSELNRAMKSGADQLAAAEQAIYEIADDNGLDVTFETVKTRKGKDYRIAKFAGRGTGGAAAPAAAPALPKPSAGGNVVATFNNQADAENYLGLIPPGHRLVQMDDGRFGIEAGAEEGSAPVEPPAPAEPTPAEPAPAEEPKPKKTPKKGKKAAPRTAPEPAKPLEPEPATKEGEPAPATESPAAEAPAAEQLTDEEKATMRAFAAKGMDGLTEDERKEFARIARKNPAAARAAFESTEEAGPAPANRNEWTIEDEFHDGDARAPLNDRDLNLDDIPMPEQPKGPDETDAEYLARLRAPSLKVVGGDEAWRQRAERDTKDKIKYLFLRGVSNLTPDELAFAGFVEFVRPDIYEDAAETARMEKHPEAEKAGMAMFGNGNRNAIGHLTQKEFDEQVRRNAAMSDAMTRPARATTSALPGSSPRAKVDLSLLDEKVKEAIRSGKQMVHESARLLATIAKKNPDRLDDAKLTIATFAKENGLDTQFAERKSLRGTPIYIIRFSKYTKPKAGVYKGVIQTTPDVRVDREPAVITPDREAQLVAAFTEALKTGDNRSGLQKVRSERIFVEKNVKRPVGLIDDAIGKKSKGVKPKAGPSFWDNPYLGPTVPESVVVRAEGAAKVVDGTKRQRRGDGWWRSDTVNGWLAGTIAPTETVQKHDERGKALVKGEEDVGAVIKDLVPLTETQLAGAKAELERIANEHGWEVKFEGAGGRMAAFRKKAAKSGGRHAGPTLTAQEKALADFVIANGAGALKSPDDLRAWHELSHKKTVAIDQRALQRKEGKLKDFDPTKFKPKVSQTPEEARAEREAAIAAIPKKERLTKKEEKFVRDMLSRGLKKMTPEEKAEFDRIRKAKPKHQHLVYIDAKADEREGGPKVRGIAPKRVDIAATLPSVVTEGDEKAAEDIRYNDDYIENNLKGKPLWRNEWRKFWYGDEKESRAGAQCEVAELKAHKLVGEISRYNRAIEVLGEAAPADAESNVYEKAKHDERMKEARNTIGSARAAIVKIVGKDIAAKILSGEDAKSDLESLMKKWNDDAADKGVVGVRPTTSDKYPTREVLTAEEAERRRAERIANKKDRSPLTKGEADELRRLYERFKDPEARKGMSNEDMARMDELGKKAPLDAARIRDGGQALVEKRFGKRRAAPAEKTTGAAAPAEESADSGAAADEEGVNDIIGAMLEEAEKQGMTQADIDALGDRIASDPDLLARIEGAPDIATAMQLALGMEAEPTPETPKPKKGKRKAAPKSKTTAPASAPAPATPTVAPAKRALTDAEAARLKALYSIAYADLTEEQRAEMSSLEGAATMESLKAVRDAMGPEATEPKPKPKKLKKSANKEHQAFIDQYNDIIAHGASEEMARTVIAGRLQDAIDELNGKSVPPWMRKMLAEMGGKPAERRGRPTRESAAEARRGASEAPGSTVRASGEAAGGKTKDEFYDEIGLGADYNADDAAWDDGFQQSAGSQELADRKVWRKKGRVPFSKRPQDDIRKIQAYQYRDKSGRVYKRRYSKYLEKEISERLENLLNRLNRGEYDDRLDEAMDELMSTPEWRDAMRRRSRDEAELPDEFGELGGRGETIFLKTMDGNGNLAWPEERKRLHDSIVDAYGLDTAPDPTDKSKAKEEGRPQRRYEVERGRHIWIVTGLPAAGKSSVFANALCLKHHARLIDSDEIKELLPEFDEGYGANAVHKESKEILDAVLRDSLRNGDNIVLPILGQYSSLMNQIQRCVREGYMVHIALNEVPPSVSAARLVQRFLDEGRFLPFGIIRNTGNKASEAFHEIKQFYDPDAAREQARRIRSGAGLQERAGLLGSDVRYYADRDAVLDRIGEQGVGAQARPVIASYRRASNDVAWDGEHGEDPVVLESSGPVHDIDGRFMQSAESAAVAAADLTPSERELGRALSRPFFQNAETAEEVREISVRNPLMGIHGLALEHLMLALDEGALVMPSIAVTRPDWGWTIPGYISSQDGDGSHYAADRSPDQQVFMCFDRPTIDRGDSGLYTGDAMTPTASSLDGDFSAENIAVARSGYEARGGEMDRYAIQPALLEETRAELYDDKVPSIVVEFASDVERNVNEINALLKAFPDAGIKSRVMNLVNGFVRGENAASFFVDVLDIANSHPDGWLLSDALTKLSDEISGRYPKEVKILYGIHTSTPEGRARLKKAISLYDKDNPYNSPELNDIMSNTATANSGYDEGKPWYRVPFNEVKVALVDRSLPDSVERRLVDAGVGKVIRIDMAKPGEIQRAEAQYAPFFQSAASAADAGAGRATADDGRTIFGLRFEDIDARMRERGDETWIISGRKVSNDESFAAAKMLTNDERNDLVKRCKYAANHGLDFVAKAGETPVLMAAVLAAEIKYEAAFDTWNKLRKSGTADEGAIRSAEMDAGVAHAEMNEMIAAFKNLGSSAGRALQIHKAAMFSDYSLAGIAGKLIDAKRKAAGGKAVRLTKEELAWAKAQADKFQDLKDQFDGLEAKFGHEGAIAALNDLLRNPPKRRLGQKAKTVAEEIGDAKKALSATEKLAPVDLADWLGVYGAIQENVRKIGNAILREFRDAHPENENLHMEAGEFVDRLKKECDKVYGKLSALDGSRGALTAEEYRDLYTDAEGVTKKKPSAPSAVDREITRMIHATHMLYELDAVKRGEIPIDKYNKDHGTDLTEEGLDVEIERLRAEHDNALRASGLSSMGPNLKTMPLEVEKTRVRNRIDEIRRRLQPTVAFSTGERSELVGDEELKSLRAELANLESDLRLMELDSMTDEEKLARLEELYKQRADAAEREYNRLAGGGRFNTMRMSQDGKHYLQDTPAMRESARKAAKWRRELIDLRAEKNPEFEADRYAMRRIMETQRRADYANAKAELLRKGIDPATKKKRPDLSWKLRPEAKPVLKALRDAKEQLQEDLEAYVFKNSSRLKKNYDRVMSIADTLRTYRASGDISGLGVQLLPYLAAHPDQIFGKASAAVKAMFKPEAWERIRDEIENDPRFYTVIEQMGVKLSGVGDADGSIGREDVFRRRAATKELGVIADNKRNKYLAASERGFNAPIVLARWEMAKDILDNLSQKFGGEDKIPPSDLKTAGRIINAMTGKGDLFEGGRGWLKELLWAPGRLAGQIQMVSIPVGMWLGDTPASDELKSYVAKEMIGRPVKNILKFTALMWFVHQMLKDDDDDDYFIEYDPRKPQFGKMKVGGRYFSFTGGEESLVRLAAKVAGDFFPSTVGRRNFYGNEPESRGNRAGDTFDTFAQFVRGRINPFASAVLTFQRERDYTGEKLDLHRAGNIVNDNGWVHWLWKDNLIPLSWSDVADVIWDETDGYGTLDAKGLAAIVPLAALALGGIQGQTYGDSAYKRYEANFDKFEKAVSDRSTLSLADKRDLARDDKYRPFCSQAGKFERLRELRKTIKDGQTILRNGYNVSPKGKETKRRPLSTEGHDYVRKRLEKLQSEFVDLVEGEGANARR